KDAARRAYRVRVDFDDEQDFLEMLRKLADQKGADKLKALVLGAYDTEMVMEGDSEIVNELVKIAKKLPSLAALFCGDIHAEESELSWQSFTDVSPILAAYPNLQHLRVRGGMGGKLGKLKSASLRSLQFEGTNSKQAQIRQVASAELPALESLELWLG